MSDSNKPHLSNKKVLRVSLLVDIIDIIINLMVALLTGSAVMLTETFQGIADSTSILLLVIGEQRSHKRTTKLHPFGYGKEIYFWSTMASFVMLAITAVISFIFGWRQFRHPDTLENLFLAYIVLGISLITNFYAFRLCYIKLLNGDPFRTLRKHFQYSTNVVVKTSLVLDLIGVLMAIIGLTALISADITGNHRLDGLGAMIMAVMLGILSFLLLVNVRNLIAGQSADAETENAIRTAAASMNGVAAVVSLKTMVLGTESVLVNLDIRLTAGQSVAEAERITAQIKRRVDAAVAGRIFTHVELVR